MCSCSGKQATERNQMSKRLCLMDCLFEMLNHLKENDIGRGNSRHKHKGKCFSICTHQVPKKTKIEKLFYAFNKASRD